jgi:hypothetical protein
MRLPSRWNGIPSSLRRRSSSTINVSLFEALSKVKHPIYHMELITEEIEITNQYLVQQPSLFEDLEKYPCKMNARMVTFDLSKCKETSSDDQPIVLILIAVVSGGGHE